MSEYLERLKADLAEAHKVFTEAQQKMQGYQSTFQAAATNFQSYQRIVAIQQAKEAREQQQNANATGTPTVTQSAAAPTTPQVKPNAQEVNKTQLVRDALRQHPGASPAELFDLVREHVGRAYLYSVLKRLRKDEKVTVKGKKYFLNEPPKPEGTEQPIM